MTDITTATIDDAGFSAALNPLVQEGALAVAISGGPDSTVLLLLAAAWAKANGRALTALTVDHGLRAESAAEARSVAMLAHNLGVAQVTLRWEGTKPRANLQAAARQARYALMGDWCRATGTPTLLLGHNLDDQAETVLLRLARGSGVDGLSAMAARTDRRGVALVRPLLGFSRARIEATLRASGQTAIEDPSNANPRFARVRLRNAQAVLADAGLTASRLAATAARMARAREALEVSTRTLLAETARIHDAGYAVTQTSALRAAPEEIGLRALARLIIAIGGLDYPPRLERLERLYRRLGDLGRGATLGGCRIVPGPRAGELLIMREAAAIDAAPVSLSAGHPALWDHRFAVALRDDRAAEVRALGPLSEKSLAERLGGCPKTKVPAAIRATLPALYVEGTLAAVPHLGLTDARRGLAPDAFTASFAGL